MSAINVVYPLVLAFTWEIMVTTSRASFVSPKNLLCPDLCNQNACGMGILMCEIPGLSQIPTNPPRTIQRVYIRNQYFNNTVLTYTNLSRYGSEEITLKKLVISSCMLTSIEPEAFSHLIYLQELDLSNNKLAFIQPNTFKSLSLKILTLDGNKHLDLVETSFGGLVVNSLSMQNCDFTNLSYDVIKQVSGHLSTLNLAENAISHLNHDFDLLFRRLDILYLGKNPFNCSCQLKWLSSTLQTRSKRIRPKALSNDYIQTTELPICHYPTNLNGSLIETLPATSFRCQIPKIKRVDIKILSATSATISCIAEPTSKSPIKWRYKQLQSAMFYQYPNPATDFNQATISVSKQTFVDFYSCLILNENGNATVDVKIVWPKDLDVTGTEGEQHRFPNKTDGAIFVSDIDLERKSYLWIKQYTFIEMVLAICGTFIITLISFIFLYIMINYRRRSGRSKHTLKGYEVGIYSESQTYDIPHVSPYHEPNTRRLLDFKTHQEIKGNW